MNGRVYEETRWHAGGINTVDGDLVEDAGLYAGTRKTSVAGGQADVADVIRQEEIKLVQRLFLAPGTKRRVVLVAGVDGDNGCAQICMRAGQTLARLISNRVCIVDANVRSPALHRLAGAEAGNGFPAAVADPAVAAGFVRQLVPGNLWLLPSAPAPDPDLLLTVDRVQPCLAELRTHFDYVIVHTAPVNLYAEPLALSQVVDGVLLVLEANVTRREIVRSVKTRLEDLDVPVVGIVLTNRTFPIPAAVYRRL